MPNNLCACMSPDGPEAVLKPLMVEDAILGATVVFAWSYGTGGLAEALGTIVARHADALTACR